VAGTAGSGKLLTRNSRISQREPRDPPCRLGQGFLTQAQRNQADILQFVAA
jgi:hypothetical protein